MILLVAVEFVVGVAGCVTLFIRWGERNGALLVLVYLLWCVVAALAIGATAAAMA